ncbi:MAG: hypothetical protein EBU61_05340, partial [Crocinitomicaceae bacterium]|nr:hypothetical protein [Crocinitomicaceae bacterium]
YTWANNGQTYSSSGTYYGNIINCVAQVLNLTVYPANYGDTIVFDLNQGVYSSENGVNYFTYPVKIKSTYTAINAFDFWFKFNESKLTFVSSTSTLNGLDVVSNFNSNNHNLSTTASMPSISNTIPANTNIMELKFIVNGPCPEVNTNDFFNSNSLINGVICNHRFSPGTPRTAVINTTTASACGSYLWNGTTYTQSLNLTITPLPIQPTVACYQTATLNTISCQWDVTGTQVVQPTIACYESATFNTTSCAWDVTGTQASQPTLACYQTAVFNTTSCSWVTSGVQAAQPTLSCYQSANFNTTTCVWDVTGTQDASPTGLACYQTAAFNTTSCTWVTSGSQAAQPTLACYESASFNTTSCSWDVIGTQAVQPTLSCYQTASFNTTTCVWDVTGTQAVQPTLACYQTATFNTTSCSWDVSGIQAAQPTLACYQTASFNTTSCSWDVSGTQAAQPTLACYQTAAFNTTTCAWVVSGTQAINTTTVTGQTGSYTWSNNGQTYTTSGIYTGSVVNCVAQVLNLT